MLSREASVSRSRKPNSSRRSDNSQRLPRSWGCARSRARRAVRAPPTRFRAKRTRYFTAEREGYWGTPSDDKLQAAAQPRLFCGPHNRTATCAFSSGNLGVKVKAVPSLAGSRYEFSLAFGHMDEVHARTPHAAHPALGRKCKHCCRQGYRVGDGRFAMGHGAGSCCRAFGGTTSDIGRASGGRQSDLFLVVGRTDLRTLRFLKWQTSTALAPSSRVLA